MDNIRSHNKPVDITLQIYNIIKNKSEYDDAQKELDKFLNNIAYWSPELIELRYWKYIYKICIHTHHATLSLGTCVFVCAQTEWGFRESRPGWIPPSPLLQIHLYQGDFLKYKSSY